MVTLEFDDAHLHRNERLAYAVVEFAADFAALVVLRLDDARGQGPIVGLHQYRLLAGVDLLSGVCHVTLARYSADNGGYTEVAARSNNQLLENRRLRLMAEP